MSVDVAPAIGAVGRARASVEAVRVLAAMRGEGRAVATADEREMLAGWSGWGPLASVFAPSSETWEQLAQDLHGLVGRRDMELGQQGTYNAFYTPRGVAAAMWRLLAGFGFAPDPETPVKVLEPGCGGGVFMDTAPDGVSVVGVERDPTAAAICAARHPNHRVIGGELQSAALGSGYAAAIGNVPFADVQVFDPAAPDGVCTSVHNYFLWRAVDALEPGGFAVLLTSRYTMDRTDATARREISRIADFVGAVRLAAGDLSGGTDVVADIVVLRRRGAGKTDPPQWLDVRVDDRIDQQYNDYFRVYPGMVCGDLAAGKTSQYGLGLTVKRRPGDPAAADQIDMAGEQLAGDGRRRGLVWRKPRATVADADQVALDGRFEGQIYRHAGNLVQVVKGAAVAVKGAELTDLVALRDLAVKLVDLESDHTLPDRKITPTRLAVATAYRTYVGRYGLVNRCTITEAGVDEETGEPQYRRTVPRALSTFGKDPDAALVFALEMYDQDTGKGEPAPILSTRQNLPPVRPTATDDPQQALAWSLNYCAGRVDVDYIAGLLRVPAADVAGLLGDAVYVDPASRGLTVAEEYLSGDVRGKHVAAVAAARHDEAFRRNADALEAALPKWLGPADITAQLGAAWIDKSYVRQFVLELLCEVHPSQSATHRAGVVVRRLEDTNQWEVDTNSYSKESVAATATWGTADVDAFKLISLALNNKTPEVTKLVPGRRPGESREVRDPDRTLLACEKQAEIKGRFEEWIWEQPDRARDLEHLYNHRFNNLAARRYSGAHITVDGLAAWVRPYPHQLEWVARALVTPAALNGHEVGAGKTGSMILAAQKLKQSGLIRKPMAVVPNHLMAQTEREFRQWFPAARILACGSDTIAASRRSFTARVATGDWDMIIIPHSAFDRMGIADAADADYQQQQVDALRAAIRKQCPDGVLVGRMVKAAAKKVDRLRAEVQELRYLVHGQDKGVRFDQLGVDYLMIDEFHRYKNLALPVRTEGFSVRPSKRATAVDVKLQWLKERYGRYFSGYTGTPISNTMVECYVVLHYTMPDYLDRIGLGSADSWASAFVQFTTEIGVTVDGSSFELKTRPNLFVNAPELRMLLSQVCDIRTAEQLGLKRPALHERMVVAKPTGRQREYTADLVWRTEQVKGRGRISADDEDRDNMLAICGDGRRMATDPVLVGLVDDEPGKLDAVAGEIIKVWRQHPDELQIAFCDVGTPNPDKGSQTYGRLRRMLTDRGMPVGRIRFAHDAKGDAGKAALFGDCNAGKVSVIMGSTDKLGVGTNIQTRCVAMHHIDAPYRPADVMQRRGRGQRPGNRHDVVIDVVYVTERTFDAYMWQLLTRKIGFITQMMSGTLDRTIEDCAGDTKVLSFSAIKASAAGQPILLEKAKVEADIKRLRQLQRGHRSMVDRMRSDAAGHRSAIRSLTAEADTWEALHQAATEPADGDEERVHDAMQGYGYRSPSVDVAGLRITFGEWILRSYDRKASAERHPRAVVTIPGGRYGGPSIEQEWRRYWKPDRIADRLRDILDTAATRPAANREAIGRRQREAANCDAAAATPWDKADQLAAAQARLTQIEARMHAQAAGHDPDPTDDVVYTAGVDADTTTITEPAPAPPAPEPIPAAQAADELGDALNAILAGLHDQLAADLAATFG